MDAKTRKKIQDEIEQWAEDVLSGRSAQMDECGVAQAIRLLKHDRDNR